MEGRIKVDNSITETKYKEKILKIGDIFINKIGQEYEIIGFFKNIKRKNEIQCIIKFTATGYITTNRRLNVAEGKVKDWSLVPKIEDFKGTIRKNSDGLEYIVLADKIEKHPNNRTAYYNIKFLKSGSEKMVRLDYIINNKIHDDFAPSVAGIGYLGNASRTNQSRKYYDLWRNMIHRCYNIKRHDYNRYGAKGITVDARWHCFEYFLEDIKELEGWDENKFINSEIQLDKDKLQFDLPYNQRTYSKNTCIWLSVEENYYYRKKRGHICSDTCVNQGELSNDRCVNKDKLLVGND